MEAFDSYRRHSHGGFSELIVIDDGSTCKDTLRVLDKLEEKGHLVIRQKNTGLGAARNNSLLKASGEVVLFLDDDNRLLAPYYSWNTVDEA